MEALRPARTSSGSLIEIDRSFFAWLLLLSIGFHVVTGDQDALVQLSSGVGVLGQYASIGPGDSVVSGFVHEVTGNCTKKFVRQALPDNEPIGIMFLPEVDESKSHKEPSQSTTCTILDQVKQAMLLGCSALLVLALNPSLFKELEGSQIFSKPVVTVSSKKNVEAMKQELGSSKKDSKKVVISPKTKREEPKPDVVSIPELTLWSTCGKASGGTHREWEGTVCLGGKQFFPAYLKDDLKLISHGTCPKEEILPYQISKLVPQKDSVTKTSEESSEKEIKVKSKEASNEPVEGSLHLETDILHVESSSSCIVTGGVENNMAWHSVVCYGNQEDYSNISFGTLWQFVFSFIVSLYVIMILRQNRRRQPLDDVEDSLQRLAKLSVSKMPTRKYKKKRCNLPQESENCAICLDDFFKGQVIRMLPCHHQFHCKCVDGWLIKRRTCPLCKLDIVDQRFHCLTSNSQSQ
ncbi:hypothetical protein HOLleu_09594 [Holothuria leucospilota]|uniref:RING-type domain-containing protein n=1 Tax=Holothuria leucospilota TaxID=206669 RepID=A0A9Q1HE02_HOLLE|nr:hypothetical protein HOLleu_09594 [Holothuria leucospilota]